MVGLMAMVVAPVPVKLPVESDLISLIWAGVKCVRSRFSLAWTVNVCGPEVGVKTLLFAGLVIWTVGVAVSTTKFAVALGSWIDGCRSGRSPGPGPRSIR